MKRLSWALIVLVPAGIVLYGCGRPVMPGSAIKGQRAVTTTQEVRSSRPDPKKVFFEAGPSAAKVRVVGFFAMDDRHKPVMELFKSLAKEYPGKVYVKYVDPDTPQGAQLMSGANAAGVGVLLNGESTVILNGNEATPANFGGEMGRYWTADILKAAVAQAVAKAYGK